jgi:hypothetical protein
MPLKLSRLTRHDEQKLVDKVAAKLPRWKGMLLTKTGHLTLVNSVLDSTMSPDFLRGTRLVDW